ncbi:MAG: hypothetical protein QNK34_11580 [Woeseiaceae bacterium]|nr:hypothetical protein [Woeseiaceae bacterium]
MTDLLVFLALSLFVTVVLARSIKIAGESERFAVFILGRFQAFKGPGLMLIAPNIHQVHRLRVGDIGVLAGSEFARFGTVDIPVGNVGSLRQGQAVRIDGFDGVEPRLVASSVPAKTMCPSCGHQF